MLEVFLILVTNLHFVLTRSAVFWFLRREGTPGPPLLLRSESVHGRRRLGEEVLHPDRQPAHPAQQGRGGPSPPPRPDMFLMLRVLQPTLTSPPFSPDRLQASLRRPPQSPPGPGASAGPSACPQRDSSPSSSRRAPPCWVRHRAGVSVVTGSCGLTGLLRV